MSILSRYFALRAVLNFIGRFIKRFLRFITIDNIEKAIAYAQGAEATTLTGAEKRERVARLLENYLVAKYGEKIPKFVIHTLIQLALLAFKREGAEDEA